MSTGWDNATLKKLKALTGKGLSTSEIGKRLGMSKNAIVGKLNRLGWNSKAGGAPSDKKVEEKATSVKKTTKASVATVAPKKAAAVKVASAKKSPVAKSVKSAKVSTGAAAKVVADKKTGSVKSAVAKTTEKLKEKSSEKVATSSKEEKQKSLKALAMHQRIVQHSLEMAALKPNQCRWPIGDPDSEDFHFCGETVFAGKPYCYEHCKQAYQFTPQKKKTV